jgi:proteasome lid subunit RPN8/RPN11
MMLLLRKSDLHSIFEHCDREFPNEACGILAGRDRTVEKVYALASEMPSPTMYRIDSKEHIRVIREMREEGRDLLGIYHSHTGSPAYPSSTDVELAYYPEAVYVIVSLLDRKDPALKGFSIIEGRITEVPVNVISEGN